MNVTNSERPCRVAVVGAGYMAKEHLRAFAEVPGVALVGIASRTRSRADALSREHGVARVYDTVRELMSKSRPDLTVVTTPELATREVCEAIFGWDTTLLVEKPFGYNLAEAEHLTALADHAGRRVYVALNRRHYASTRALRASLDGVSGERLISVVDQEDAVAALRAGQPPAVVQNWMFANAIHLIDYFSFLGRGTVTEVTPVLRWRKENPGPVVGHVAFSSGDRGLYQAVWNAPGPWMVSVSTPSVRWELRPLERAHYQTAGERQTQSVEPDPIDSTFKPGLHRQAVLAVQAALGESVSELPTAQDALLSMRLAHALYS